MDDAAHWRDDSTGHGGGHKDASPPRAVVVDDDRDSREATSIPLRELGFEVLQAAHGREALELLGQHGGAVILVTDLIMPVMDGYTLITQAKRKYPELRVVATTGMSGGRAMLELAREGGADKVIAKPIDFDDFEDSVRDLVPLPSPR